MDFVQDEHSKGREINKRFKGPHCVKVLIVPLSIAGNGCSNLRVMKTLVTMNGGKVPTYV